MERTGGDIFEMLLATWKLTYLEQNYLDYLVIVQLRPFAC